jgi:UDP-N-acetylglucosamine:LPS N-acetylglucosamine transferase
VIPFGFTDRVPELMAASDVVISSSGDTCREARVVGRGLILLDVVPGHGRENLMHELELGGAAVSTTDPSTLVAAVESFLERQHDLPPVSSPHAWETELRAALASVGFA